MKRWWQPLAQALGVTRVARLTGLDRCGVEVASAARPRGHVLQVTQGKGHRWEDAVHSALGEAAELLAAETPDEARLLWRDGAAWTEARWLDDGDATLVRADAVWCPPQEAIWLGQVRSEWTSNGLASHARVEDALEHAVLELVERDAVARTFPQGWTGRAPQRRLRVESSMISRIEALGFELAVFDATPPGARLPTVAALLFDQQGGPIPLTAGYACRRTGLAAAEAAVLEAAQSRLTEVHGAREDVTLSDREAGESLRAALRASKARRSVESLPEWSGPLSEALQARVAWLSLMHRPLQVVKVFGEGLLRSELI